MDKRIAKFEQHRENRRILSNDKSKRFIDRDVARHKKTTFAINKAFDFWFEIYIIPPIHGDMAELVECARLEIAYSGNTIEGSNPPISAIKIK